MPKETFFHLNPIKKEKIEKAIENEFGRTSFEKASISNIIEEAEIPRGSFYQYFENKEDAVCYIVQKYIELEKESMKKILKKCHGDIFATSLEIFDTMVKRAQEESNWKLARNIFRELKKNNIDLFEEEEDHEEFHKEFPIDCSKLAIQSKEELKDVIRIISLVTRSANIDVSNGRFSKEEARIHLKRQLEILKRGMEK